MEPLPPLPRELVEDADAGRLPPGAPLVLIILPSLVFWGSIAAFLLHR